MASTPSASTPQVATAASSSRLDGRAEILTLLETSIVRREASQALACFDRLQQQTEAMQNDPALLQRLALLVAKRGDKREIPRAVQILRNVLATPGFVVDDYTQLASIYVMDACLRLERLQDALQVYEAAIASDVLLDLPVYDALVRALVDAGRVDEAEAILKSTMTQNDVKPTERTFAPILVAIMQRCQYEEVTALLDHGRSNGVDFSREVCAARELKMAKLESQSTAYGAALPVNGSFSFDGSTDCGFAITPENDAVKIRTLGGRSMSQLAVSKLEFDVTGCTAFNCSQPNNESYYANEFCTGTQMLTAAKCVIEDFGSDASEHLAMWSNGGDPDMTPEIRAVKHAWLDSSSNEAYVVYAVHTMGVDSEPSYGSCNPGGYGSLVVPCSGTRGASAEVLAVMTQPVASPWVTTWLKTYQSTTESTVGQTSSEGAGFDLLLLIPIAFAALMVA
ncbi:hypothetical protein BBJ28_00025993, partial [Nothophytophthora sp. Chile5]